ncbi:hypothetical protein [Niveispirillum sp. KHB5.9]|uniref:hypothetical protein n=1 Tax=Niveispirillum sp. KHB5.9 TaxID=3400269 RepID=UPI003A86DA7B
MNRWKLTGLAFAAGITAFAGGYAAGTALPASQEAIPAMGPVTVAVAPMIVPVWGQGRITGFVAVEMAVELAPGSDGDLLLPGVRDRLLGDLYDIGAQGGMQPGIIDPAALQARLLLAAGEATGGNARNLVLTKLILQENRRKGV